MNKSVSNMQFNSAKMVDPFTFKRWNDLQAKGIKKVSKSNTKCDDVRSVQLLQPHTIRQ